MRIYDLIEKKKMGEELATEEIQFMIDGYVKEQIPDYQISAMLMAIYFKGMSDRELEDFTLAMAHSGDMIDLSAIEGIKVDKHSTGGVGDKTTLIIAPIVAACGGKVAKMAGRGLGYTGGTIDKLESIPGFQTALPESEFFQIVNKIGLSVISQTRNLAPADKKLYALRDMTATVNSIPLIAASVMSKKLASGSDKILLDVTCGSGAFMKKKEDAVVLAQKMVLIGEQNDRETVAFITDMDNPLGKAIGNSLEIKEVVEVLKGKGEKDLHELCIELAANMLLLGTEKDTKNVSDTHQHFVQLAEQSLQNGSAFKKFLEMVQAHKGDISVIEDTDNFERAQYNYEVVAPMTGYVIAIDTEQCGIASMVLGAGRETQKSQLDFSAGIYINKKRGDKVNVGDTIATLYSSSFFQINAAEKLILDAYTIGKENPKPEKLIIARIDKNGVVWF